MSAALPSRAGPCRQSRRREHREKSMSADLLAAEPPQTLPSELPRTDAYYRLKADIEDFLYAEADLLDERRFREWLNLLANDIIYFMPIRRNVKFGQHAQRENTVQG